MKTNLVIGIDCSTTSSKAIAWDMQGNLIAEGRSSLFIQTPRSSWYEQRAESWWEATCEALKQVVDHIDARQIAGLSIAHQRETFVPVDQSCLPMRNALLWMDQRAGPLLPHLETVLNKDNFHTVTGKPLTANLTICKIDWLHKYEPSIFTNVYKYLDVHAYLIFRLTGLYRTGWGCADPTGLFDMLLNDWSLEILAKIGIRKDQLPEAFPPGEVIGEITRDASLACHLPEGLPVVTGLGDGQATGLGANISQPGDAYLSLGSSVVCGTFSDKYLTSNFFRTMYGGIPGTYMLESVTLAGGHTIQWLIDKFMARIPGSIDPDQNPLDQEILLEEGAKRIPPGSDGLILVPYWNSALDPYWDAAASGIVVGWRGIHGRLHLYRAILEGIAFEQRLHLEGVENILHAPIKQLITVGGGATNNLWCQIIADITGKPVIKTLHKESASLGAAILAAYGVGLFKHIQSAAQEMVKRTSISFQPDLERHAFYTRLFEGVYRHLYPSLRTYLKALSSLHTIEGNDNGSKPDL